MQLIRSIIILAVLLLAPSVWAQLELSDFVEPEGQEIILIAVISAAAPPGLYDHRTGQSAGTLVEGGLVLLTHGTLNRIRDIDARFVFNKTGGDGVGFNVLFGVGGALRETTLWVQVPDGTVASVEMADRVGTIGGGFVDFTNDKIHAVVDTITDGSRFLLAITRTVTDNCAMRFNNQNLASPSDLRLGSATPIRFYLGSALVCGDPPQTERRSQ